MFQKFSGPKPPKFSLKPKINPANPTAPTPSKKGIDPAMTAGTTGYLANEIVDKASKTLKDLQESGNAADKFIGRVLENAQNTGKNFEKFNVNIGEREVLISQLLSTMPEPLLATYFDEFLFKKDIPWTITKEIMQKAVDAERSGSSAQDVLDFALVFFNQRVNYGNTIAIIDTALDLQPQMRNINIFKYLKDNLQGKRNSDLSFVMMGPDNIDNATILNRLLGMVHARGAEDLEVLRRGVLQKALETQRAREIGDTVRAVYDGLLTMEFQSALKRNVQFVTEQFQLGTKDPLINSFAKILYDLKLGQEFRSELFAGLEGRTTAEETPGLSQQRSTNMTRSVRSSDDYSFVKLAQTSPINQVYLDNIIKFVDTFISVNQALYSKIDKDLKENKIKANEINIASSISAKLKLINTDFNTVKIEIKALKNPQEMKAILDKFSTACSKFQNIQDEIYKLGATPSNVKLSANVSFLKIAQGPTQPVVNQETGTNSFNVSGPNQSIAGGQGKFLTDDAAKISETFFRGAAGVAAGTALALGEWKSALALGTSLLLQAKNKNVQLIANDFKIPVPVDATPIEVLQEAAEAFSKLTDNQFEIKEYQANDEFIKNVQKTINLMESNLQLILDTQVKTQEGLSTTPLASPEKAEKAHNEFVKYLMTAADHCRRQYDLINTVVNRQKDSDQTRLLLGYATQYTQYVLSILKNIEKKISEYYSLDKKIKNDQLQKFVAQFLRQKFPEVDKYLSVGLSVADILGSEGGILQKFKEIINIERDSWNKLYAEYQKVIREFPDVNITSAQVVRPNAPANVNVSSTSFPNPTPTVSENVVVDANGNRQEGGYPEGFQRSASVQFSNVIFEKRLAAATVDPLQQKKYDYYITKLRSGANLQSLRNSVYNDATFTNPELKFLVLSKIDAQIKNPTQQVSYGTEGSLDTGQVVVNNPQGTLSEHNPFFNNSSSNSTTGPSSTTSGFGATTSSPSGRQLSTTQETQRNNDLNKIYQDVAKQTQVVGVLPSLETLNYKPELMLASLRDQLFKVYERINKMEQAYYELMKNENIGTLRSLFGHNEKSKFIKLADNIIEDEKSEENNKEIEADLELENYWNDLLPGVGTALEHSPKYRGRTMKRIPVHHHGKFKKI